MKKNQKSLRKVVASSATRRTRRQTLRSALPELLESRTLMSTYLVTNTGDSGTGSLRAAISSVDGDSSPDTIQFQIPGSGVQAISLNSALPAITNTVTIDGTTQTGYASSPLIELNGSATSGAGLDFEAGSAGSQVFGLTIDSFSGAGVVLNSGGALLQGNYIGTDPTGNFAEGNKDGVDINSNGNALIGNLISGNSYNGVSVSGDGNTLAGNLIGPNVTGTQDIGNSVDGSISGSGGVYVINATNTTIGGTNATARNVISGNYQGGIVFVDDTGSGNFVEGNYVGVDATGEVAMGNSDAGIDLGTTSGDPVSNVTILNNVVSGNFYSGIYLNNATHNTIQGNLIGTDAAGQESWDNFGNPVFGNFNDGITIDADSANNLIGGTTPAARNVIAGNYANGITVVGAAPYANDLEGNFIGVDSSGHTAAPNIGDGILVDTGLLNVGSDVSGAGNVISGNDGVGIDLQGGTSVVYGNLIGLASDGSTALGNGGDGVRINQSSRNIIGGTAPFEGNVIADNGAASPGRGVNVVSGVKNDIEGNSIYGNATLGIDLGGDGVTNNDSQGHSGPNNYQDFPVLNTVTITSTTVTVSGMLANAAVGSQYTIDLYNNLTADPTNHGQGKTFVGSELVTIGSSGSFSATFNVSPAPSGTVWSATATDLVGNTSEFSADFTSSTVQKHDAQIQLTSSLNPAAFGQSITFTATVTASGIQPTGTVTFYDGINNLGTFSLSGATASFTTSSLSVATHSISITYTGDDNYNQGSGALLENVTTAPTATGLSVNPTVSLYGQNVMLTATVTPTVNGITPSGTVNFYDGVTLLGPATLSNGVATLTVYTLGIGTHSLVAQYLGDSNFAPSQSSAVPQYVNPLPSSISGTVYNDPTGNGFSSDDLLLANVTVDLFQVVSGSNSLLATAVTDSNGQYSFTNLGPGNYFVQEVVPAGSTETGGAAGYSVTATNGTNVTGDNFDNFQNVSISGKAFNDLTGNGISGDDTALPGVTVQLLSGATVIASTTTASDGSFSFANVGPGSYTVSHVVQSGWIQTAGVGGYSVVAQSGQNVGGDNFADFQNFTIGGTVYNDATGNRITSDDTGLSGVTVQLMMGSTLVASTTSGSGGAYAFANVGPGAYTVSELVPAGWTQTVGVGGYSVSGQSGHNVTDNFAQFHNVSISGVAYTDLTGNGFSSDDTPMAGVTVDLFVNGSSSSTATATTGSNGAYSFANLGPGSYTVQEVVPAGMTETGGAAGYTNGAQSGQNVSGDNFDNYLPPSGAINGYVFCDDNLDGVFGQTVQDGTVDPESGEGLATLTLTGTTTTGSSVSMTTTTASNGYYSFSGLAAGTYTVSLTGFSPNHQAEQSHGSVKISESTTETLTAGQTLSGAAMGAATKNNGLDFAEIAPGGLQGFVWDDANNDGNIDFNEAGIVNVTITLNGVTYTGAKVSQSTVTDNNGEYIFTNLQPGTYTLTESTPSGFTDGKDMVGSLGGSETYSSNCGSSSGCSTGSTNCGSNCGNSYCGQTNCGSDCSNSSCGQTNCGGNYDNSNCGSCCYNDCYGSYGYNCFTNYSNNCYSNNGCHSNNCGNCGGNSNYCNGQNNCGWNSGCNNAQNTFSNVQIGGCEDVGVGYNFGETGGKLSGCTTDTASLAFWHNSYGQALLCSLNGGPNSTALGNWLATMFPKMYGSQAKVNFAGMTNSQIAAFYNSNDFNVSGIKLDAAVLSAALSSYVTNSTSAGGNYATKYGFTVSAQGVGYETINVGSDGVAFGVSNNSSITILQALDATDQQAVNGSLYNGNATLRSDAYAIYAAIAQNGLST